MLMQVQQQEICQMAVMTAGGVHETGRNAQTKHCSAKH